MYTQFSYNIPSYPIAFNDMPSIGSSPTIATPYLDSSSSIGTPYLDNSSSSPFIESMADISPYLMFASFGVTPLNNNPNNCNTNGVKNMNDNKDDVCIARYLDGHENNNEIAKLTHDPIAKFNGDPSLLLIDKSKSPIINNINYPSKLSPTLKLDSITEEDLFPPLNSSQQSAVYSPTMKSEHLENMLLDDFLGLDAGSPLSESMDIDHSDDDLYEEEAVQQPQQTTSTTKNEQAKEESQEKAAQSSRKRKTSSSNSTTATSSTTNKKRKNNTKSRSAKKSLAASTKEAKVHQCPLCDHVSKRRYNLATHIKIHDKSRVKEFDCPQCHKRFDRRHDRDRHLATVHRGERSHACDHCRNHFTRRDALNRHLIQKHKYDDDLME